MSADESLPAPSLDTTVAAVLVQRSREDRDALLEDLVATLMGVVPAVQVERSLIMRRVTAVKLPLGEHVYLLKKSGGAFEAARQHLVRGVAISTTPMEIGAFLAELGVALEAELGRTEKGRAALQAWLR